MISNGDVCVRRMAAAFQREMGGLTGTFDAYRRRWRGPVEIASDPAGFVAATAAILAALRQRIDREDEDLYDLCDEVAR
jgi:hypothetical protein